MLEMAQVELIELTPEELEIIMKKRERDARREQLKECESRLVSVLREIYDLGGAVRLPYIGRKYVSGHCPKVRPENVKVSENGF